MRIAPLGNSGLAVSNLAFGAMTLGQQWAGPLAGLTGEHAASLVKPALDSGINFFDTADVYHKGESEILLGKYLAARRDQVTIATKAGMRIDAGLTKVGLSARRIIKSVDASLKRLGTDWIDVYIGHRPDPLTSLKELMAALDQLVRAGKVRYLGFSNWPAWLAAKAIALQQANGWARFFTAQMYYSLLARDIEVEYVPMALDACIGTMVPGLSSGFLSDKYTRETLDGGGHLNQMDLLPFDREQGYSIIDSLKK
jgi:aryl-alcohol dehydrogenase-like predicted oxidoreductase